MEKGLNEFKYEIAFLVKVRHHNLISLLNYCFDGIPFDVVRRAEYLHSLAHRSFIHRDLK